MLHHIRLRNYKCFKDIDIECAPLTVLSGLNSTGKSTVLDSILLLRQSMVDGYIDENTRLRLRGKYVDLGSGLEALYEYADDDNISMQFCFDNANVCNFWRADTSSELKVSKNKDNSFRIKASDIFLESKNEYLDFIYLSADRIVPKRMYNLYFKDSFDKLRIDNRGEWAIEYLDKISNRKLPIPDMVLSSDNQNDTIRQSVESWLNIISPGIRIKTQTNLDFDSVQLRYEYSRLENTSRDHLPMNVGFGITYILPVILSIIAANKGAMLLIENPEVHLHPRGQTELGRLLAIAAANGVQIILETHSDHIINGIRLSVKEGKIKNTDAIIHYFENSLTTPCCLNNVVRLNEKGKLIDCPEEFQSEWEMSLIGLI